MGVPRLVSADSDSGKLPDVVLYELGERFLALSGAGYAYPESAPIDPARRGAKGDGATDDTTAIKAALADAGAGGIVRLRPGRTYIVSSLITLPSNATLEMYGATLKHAPGIEGANLLTVGSGGGSILGGTIDLNKANTTNPNTPLKGVGLYISSAGWANLTVRDLRVVNGHQYGIYLTNFNGLSDAASAPIQPATFTNVTVDGCGYGMGFGKFGGLNLVNCSATNSTLGSNVYMSLMREPQVLGGRFNGSLVGSGLFFDYVYNPTVTNPFCDGNKMHGLVMGGGVAANASSRGFVVVGGSYKGNQDCGITCDPTKTGAANIWQRQDGRLVGVDVEGNGRAGIQLENSGYVAIIGGSTRNNGKVSSAVGYGVRATGAYFVIDGLVASGNPQAGIALLGSSSTPDVGHHRIGVNLLTANTGGGYFLGDTLVDMKFSATQATPND